jgi:dynein heavy chain, axonemal
MQNARKSDDVPERLGHVAEHFTYALYTNVCRSLFEKDKLLFAALLSARVLMSKHKLGGDRFAFLLTGGVGLPEAKAANPAPCASPNLCVMYKDLPQSLPKVPDMWLSGKAHRLL